MANRVGGLLYFKIDGVQYSAEGEFTHNLGAPKREMVIGPDGVHGYSELPQAAFIDGMIIDNSELDRSIIVNMAGVTVTLELANGKVVVLRDAVYTAEGDETSERGSMQVRFESGTAEELLP